LIAQTGIFFSSSSTEVLLKDVGDLTCTRLITDFIFRIRQAVCPFRSALKLISQLATSEDAVPLGLCIGGFSSTAGYVPGNEACCRNNKRLSLPLWLIISIKALLVFIQITSEIFRLPLARPFGLDRKRIATTFR